MYAFLSKVFGRKKDDRDASSSSQPVLGPGELLGGRFEAVSANVSPSSQFVELDPNVNEVKDKEKEKDKDIGFSFFKGKWRPASPDVKPTRKLDILPHLSLNFQELKAEPATPNIGLLFTTDQILSDTDIGQRRLNPSEALILVQACSRAIVARGLETLGIMHPNWYAASHKIQRRVISHFIYLLNLERASSIPSPTSPLSAFESEVNDTLSPHDIAAILRWGLRHVQIEGDSFGTGDRWYNTFLESESAAGYPPKAFSDKLAPLLPTAHLQLLTATLEIFSSLAAHAEVNGTSGSKLCKLFGLWLLIAHHVEDKDDWNTFYARWERTGRMLEHLFLSRIRDQSTDQRMPIRLLELIHKYPYNQDLSSPTTDLSLLPHPPFTTRLHDALFVRIEIDLPYGKRKPSSKLHPLSLLADAFSTKVEGEFADFWAKITTASKNGDSSFLTNIFTDDTISILSFVPNEPSGHEVKSPTFGLASSSSVSPHKPSCSVDDADKLAAFVPGHPKASTEFSPMSPLSPLSNGVGSDWAQFSASGFLEVNPNIVPLASTLLDTDIEKTTPPEAVTPLSRKSSKRSKAASPSRKSFDIHRPTSPEAKLEGIEEQKNIIKASRPRVIQLDEAFIDFWSDSLLDPISADWPTFIICKFKSSLVSELAFAVAQEAQKQKTIQWLLLEQVYTIRAPPTAPIVVVRPKSSSPISPSPSLKNRFSFWSVSRTASNSSAASQKGKKKEQELRVGEMGELLEEEPKREGKEPRAKSPIFRSRRSLDIAPKSTEVKRKSVIKPAEEAKIDEETAGVAAVATGIVVASAAVVITNEIPTAQTRLVEAVTTTKAKVDHSAEIPAMDGVSTGLAATETVTVPSPEPAVKDGDMPVSTVEPDVVSSLEAAVETKPLESEHLVEGPAIEPGVIVGEEVEGRTEIESSPATQADPVGVADVAPINTETITEVGETIDVVDQQVPIVVPLFSAEVAIPEPEVEMEEAPEKHNLNSSAAAEESRAEPETSCYAIEETPAAIDHGLLVESGRSDDDENAVDRSETIEARATEAEHIFSPVEDKTDVADDKTSDSAPILAAAQQLPEVASQEILQPQSTAAVLATEDVLDNKENHVEIITLSTTLEGHGMAEHIETKEDFTVKETKHDFAPVPDVNEPEIEAVAEPPLIEEQGLPSTVIEPELDTAHLDEPASVPEGSSSKDVLNAEAAAGGGVGRQQSEFEQEITFADQDVDPSSKDAVVAHEVKAETHGTDAAGTFTDDLAAAEFPETEQPVISTTEGGFTKHLEEAAIVAVGLAAVENISSIDKDVPEVTHEATPESGNDSLESGTTLDIEPQREPEVDVTAPDIHEATPKAAITTNEAEFSEKEQPVMPATEGDSTNHLNEAAIVAVEDVPEVAHETSPEAGNDSLESGTTLDIEPQREQEVDIPAPEMDEATPESATTTNDLAAAEFPEKELPVMPTTEGDSINHVNEAAIVAVGLVAEEDFSSIDKDVPEVTHEATPEAGNDPVESGTTLDIEPEREHEVDVTAPGIHEATHEAATTTNDLAATESPEKEPTTEGDSTKHVNEAAIVAVGLGAVEDISSIDKDAPEVTHEATSEAGNDSAESGTTLDLEPQREQEVDVAGPEIHEATPEAPITTNEAEFLEKELPIMPTTEGDSTNHVNEPAIVALGLATAEVAGVAHEAMPEAGNDSVESGTALDIEPQREHEVDVTAPETEHILPDVHSNLRNDLTPVPLSHETETSHVKAELVAERHVETTSTAATNSVPIDVEVQPDPTLSEAAPNAQKDIEETEIDGASNIKDEPIPESDVAQHIADTEGPLEDLPASSTKEYQNAVQLEPEVDFVAPAEEDPSAITQVLAEKLKDPGETITIPEDVNVEIPVDARSEHAAVVETSSTDEIAEVIVPHNIESPETLTPLVEPSYKSSDEEIVGSHVVPEVNVHVPETQVFGEAAVIATDTVESDLPSEELPVTAEPEERVTHEEATPEVDVPVTVETELEILSTKSTSEDKPLEVEKQHVLLSPESRDAANIELNDDIIPPAAAEPGPEVVSAVVAPVLGTFEVQTQHSVEETTEEVHIVEVANETELVVPNEGRLRSAMEVLSVNSQLESAVEPVEAEAGESNRTAEVEPQALTEESPVQMEEDRSVLTEDDTTLSRAVHPEPLDTELVPIEDPAVVVKSEPDSNSLHMDTSIPVSASDVDVAVTAQVHEDQLENTVIPESGPDLPSHDIETEGPSSINKEADAVHDTSPSSISLVDVEVQPETQVVEETLKADSGVTAVNILPEALTSTTSDSAPILAAAQQLPEVASQEIFQPQSTAVHVTEDMLDNGENSVEITTSSTKSEGPDTAEDNEAKDYDVKEAKHDIVPVPVLPEINSFEPDGETEATVEPPLPTSIEQDLPTTIEPEPDTAHPDEPAAIPESSPKIVLNAELEQETLAVSSPSAQETVVDDVSGSKDALTAVVARGVETEVEADAHGTDVATTTSDLAAAEFPEKEAVMPTTEGDFSNHVNEAAIVALGLATAEVLEVTHGATPEAVNDLVESGTTLDIEPQREHEVDVTAPEIEGTIPDIHSSLPDDPTPVPLPRELETSLVETELLAERQVETTSTAVTDSVPIDVEVQPDSSLNEPAANTQKDMELQTQVEDASNIKDEPIPESDVAQHIEATGTEGPLEDVPASSTKESQNTVQLEPEVEFVVAPTEEESTAITQVAVEDLLPKIEAPGETIPTPEDATVSVANAEAPVDARSEHAAVVETSSADELADVILPPNVEESPETLTPLAEPSYKSSDDEIVGSHVVPEVDAHVPETQAFGEAAPLSIMAAVSVESDIGRGVDENMSVPSEEPEPPVNAEPEEPVTHEEATPEVNVPITVETEPEPFSTKSTSEDKVLEVEEQHVLLSPNSRDAANIELNDDTIPPAAAEPEPEVVATVVAPVLGPFELQPQHSVEETKEEVHIVEAANETELVVPNEESTVEPVEAQLEIPEEGESDRTAEVEPKTIPATEEESAAQIEEERPVLADESAVSAPLNEENPLQQFEVTANSQDSDAEIEDSQNVIQSHEPAAEGNDISDSTAEEGAPTDTSVNAAIPASIVESIDPNVEHMASSDISKPESELPLGDGDTPPVDTPQDNNSITTVELDTGPAHVDEMPLEDKDDVAAEPSVDPASEFSTILGGASIEHSYPLDSTLDTHIDAEPSVLNCPQVPNDESDIANEHEQSAEQPEIFERTGSSMTELSISVAEIGASQPNVTKEPSEDPKRFVETPEIEGISETHSQVSLASVQVLPETKDNLVKDLEEPAYSHIEVEESSPTTEPLVAEIASAISEPVTVMPEELQTENDSISQVEEDSPSPTDDVIQEKAVAENSSTAEPSVTEMVSVVSEPVTLEHEELQVDDSGIAQGVDNLVDPPPLDNSIQKEAVVPTAELKETVENSTDEPSVADTLLVSSQPATVVPEEPQSENDSIAQEDLAVPPLIAVNPVQEEANVSLVEFDEGVEKSYTAEPPVAEIAPVVSELPTEVPENDNIAQTEDIAPPTDKLAQDQALVPDAEVNETVQSSSTDEPSVADTLLVNSEPVIVVPDEPQTENDGITQADEDLVDPPPPTDDLVQDEASATHIEFEEAVENSYPAEQAMTETTPVVSEPTEVPEELQIDSVAQAEDLAPPTDNLAQEEGVLPIAEAKETVESSSTDEPSAATVVPEEPQADNNSIVQVEEDLAVPPLPTVNPVQEEPENSSTAQPAEAEIAPVVSGLPTAVHEEFQIENDGIAQAKDLAPPTDNLAQEEAVGPIAEFKEAVESSSTDEPSGTDTVVHEGVRIQNGDISRAEEGLIDPPPTDDPVQEEANATNVEFEEAAENSFTAQSSVAEIAPVVSELPMEVPEEVQIENDGIAEVEGLVDPPPTDDLVQENVSATPVEFKEAVENSFGDEPSEISVVSEPTATSPEELEIKNDGTAQAEDDLVDPLLPTDKLVQEEANATLVEEAVNSSSPAEPSVAEIVSVVSEPPTEVPKEFSIISDSVALAGDGSIDPPLRRIETEHIGERTEERGKILETTAVDDLVVDQAALGKVDMQSFDGTEAPETHINGHSTKQETIETHDFEASSVNLATDDDDNIQADPKVIEPIHPSHISPASLEAPTITASD